jgi:heme oxygenase (mycobilin-producing)
MSDSNERARIVFLIRVPEENREKFLRAYEQIRYEVADGVPGHLLDQVCQSTTDPEQWLITSEWESLDAFVECMTEARSIKFAIREETSKQKLAG